MVAPGPRVVVLRRAAVDTGSLVTVLATVLVVCTLVSGVVASLPALQAQALHSVMRQTTAADSVVEVIASYDELDPDRQDRDVREALAPVTAPAGGAVVRSLETVAHRRADGPGAWSFLSVTGRDGTPAVAAVTGRLPGPPGADAVEVAALADVPDAPEPGATITLVSPFDDSRVEAKVVGTWRPVGDARAVKPSATGLLVSEGSFERLGGRGSSVDWRAVPAYDDLDPDRLDDLAAAAAGVEQEIEAVQERLGGTYRVENPLVEVLDARGRELLAQRMLLLVPALMLLLVGAAGAALVAGSLAENRRVDENLMRSRGAGRRQVLGPTALEASILCAAGAVVGPLLATGVVRIGGVRPALDGVAWVAGVAAGAVCWAALVAPAAIRALGGERIEQLAIERRRRRMLTSLLAGVLLLVGLGLVAVVRLRGFSSAVADTAGGTGRVDPLVVASPALLLFALVAVLVLALGPLLFRLTELLVRSRGLVLPLGTRAVSRAPGRAVPLALAVALVAGGVVFATAQAASQRQAREDRAAYEVGADVRVLTPPPSLRAGEAEERDRLASLPGVTDVSAVYRELDFVDDVATEVLAADLTGAAGSRLLATADAPAGTAARLGAAGPVPGTTGVPVAITTDLAAQAGLGTGDTIRLTLGDAPVSLEVVQTVPGLPTLTAGRTGMLVDAETLRRSAPGALPEAGPAEWWLAAPDAALPAAKAVSGMPDVAVQVVTREDARRRLVADPGAGGAALSDVMTVTAVGALLVGGIMLFSVVVLRRREREEQASFLRALGAGPRDVTLTVATEYSLTVTGGLVTGTVAGIVAAAIALRATTLGPGGHPLVPPPSLEVPWAWTVPLLVLLLAVPVVTLLVVRSRRTGSRGSRTAAALGEGARA